MLYIFCDPLIMTFTLSGINLPFILKSPLLILPSQSLKSSLYLIQVHNDHSCVSCTVVFLPNVKLNNVMPFIAYKLSRNASLIQFNYPKGKKCSLHFYPPSVHTVIIFTFIYLYFIERECKRLFG